MIFGIWIKQRVEDASERKQLQQLLAGFRVQKRRGGIAGYKCCCKLTPPACCLLLLIYTHRYNNFHVNSSNCPVPALGPWGCRASSTTRQAAFLLRRQTYRMPAKKKKSVRPNVACLGWEWERDERTGEKWRNRKLENGNTSCLIRGCQKVSIMSVDMYLEVFPPLSGAGNASITHHKESEGLLGMGGVRMPPFVGVRGESASPGYLTPRVCMLLCVVSSGQLSHPNFVYCFSSSSSLQCKLDTVNKAVFYWCRPRVYWCVHFALSTLCSDSGVPAMK